MDSRILLIPIDIGDIGGWFQDKLFLPRDIHGVTHKNLNFEPFFLLLDQNLDSGTNVNYIITHRMLIVDIVE